MILFEFRPITEWPGQLLGSGARKQSPFRGSYNDTLKLLNHELDHLLARDVVIELAIASAEVRVDGMLRANTKPAHPGVILSFDSRHGALRYFTDRFDNLYSSSYGDGWKANLRAIALSLEALRKVDRYGVSRRGEQYTGWSALGSGGPIAAPAAMTLEAAIAFLHQHAPGAEWDHDDPDAVAAAYRIAAKRLHPDAGGDTELFKRLQEAKRVLDGGR